MDKAYIDVTLKNTDNRKQNYGESLSFCMCVYVSNYNNSSLVTLRRFPK